MLIDNISNFFKHTIEHMYDRNQQKASTQHTPVTKVTYSKQDKIVYNYT